MDLGPFVPLINALKGRLHMTEQDVSRGEVVERLKEMAGHIAGDPAAEVTVMRAKISGRDVMILACTYEGKTLEAGAPGVGVPARLPA